MSNLQKRIITALILGCIALAITWIGGAIYTAFVLLVGAAVFYEWQGLTVSRQSSLTKIMGWVFYLIVAAMQFAMMAQWIIIPVWQVFVTVIAGAVFLGLLSGRNAIWVGFGFIYAVVPPIALSLLRGDEPFGFGAVIFLYAVVWGTDIAAYFNGRAMGGPKLAPRLSPNKTWSGAIGGAAVGIAGGILVAFLLMNTSPANCAVPVLALVLSIASQAGDIGESWVKRHFNVKDSSQLLPGHGGFMDRVDGLVAAAVLLYIIAAIFTDATVPANLFNII